MWFRPRKPSPAPIREGTHSFFVSGTLDFRCRPPRNDHVANAVGEIQQFVDGRSAAKPGAVAFQAAFALDKIEIRILLPDRDPTPSDSCSGCRTGLRQFAQIMRTSRWAKNAVQRRNEVVRIHSHIQKSAENVDHVVGVNRRKHQVTGQRGLNRDLRGFHVADLSHHDLVRIVAQDRAQARARTSAPSFR